MLSIIHQLRYMRLAFKYLLSKKIREKFKSKSHFRLISLEKNVEDSETSFDGEITDEEETSKSSMSRANLHLQHESSITSSPAILKGISKDAKNPTKYAARIGGKFDQNPITERKLDT